MVFIRYETNVLLPEWILSQKKELSEREYHLLVRKYVLRYRNCELVGYKNDFAVCNRLEEKGKEVIKRK